VRVALGAGRDRIVRQLLTESGLLALCGGIAGVALGGALLAVAHRLPTGTLPPYARLAMDGTTALVAVGVAVVLGTLAGVPAAVAAAAAKSESTLRDASRNATEGGGRRRARGVLVAGQISLCLSLLVAAAMLARSFAAMTAAPLGFDPGRVLTFSVKGPVPAPDAERRLFFHRFEEEIAALPGVEGVGHTDMLPGDVRAGRTLAVEGAPAAGEDQPLVAWATVTDGYFDAMRNPLLRGRRFDERDGGDATPVVIVSASLARRYWPPGEAVGRRIRRGADDEWAEIIGIAADVRGDPSRAVATPIVYASSRQSPLRSSRTYVVRTSVEPLSLASPVRSTLDALDGSVPMDALSTLRRRVDDRLALSALPAAIVAGFAILALLLASIGVYALYASMAEARRREYGVRRALGSTRAGIIGLAVRQGGIWMLVGFLGGVPASLAALRALRGMLYGEAKADPLVFGAAMLLMLAAAAIALLIPVRRAAKADALTALR
jgi:predicted permease